MFNYRFYITVLTLISVIGKIREMFVSFDMCLNPIGETIKILGIIGLVVFLYMPNSDLQAKDC